MKVKKKGGKVFPSPSSSASSSSVNGEGGGEGDVLSVLKLLPAAILAIVSILCLEDREVLAYMITRSINSTNVSSSPTVLSKDTTKKSNQKMGKNNHCSGGCGGVKSHKPPIFQCDCFDCYANYWHRWNSSSNRDLIQEAIEAFEEHLSTDEKSSRKATQSGKQRRVKPNRRNVELPLMSPLRETDKLTSLPPADNIFTPMTSSKNPVAGSASLVVEKAVFVPPLESTRRGFARKVFPDLLGFLSSRLWNPIT